MWLKRNEKRRAEGRSGQRGTEEEQQAEEEREKTEHMDTGSLALSVHMPSHQMVCSHPGDVATKRTPAPFKSLLPTISSCSHVGRELESRQKSSVSAANVRRSKCTLRSQLRHHKAAPVNTFSKNTFPFDVTLWSLLATSPGHGFFRGHLD